MNTQDIAPVLKHTADVTAYTAIGATLLGWLPNIAAVLSIVWISIQIWESKTFTQYVRSKFRKKK